MVDDGLPGEVADQERVEAPVDRVEPLESLVDRQEQRVLLVCKTVINCLLAKVKRGEVVAW